MVIMVIMRNLSSSASGISLSNANPNGSSNPSITKSITPPMDSSSFKNDLLLDDSAVIANYSSKYVVIVILFYYIVLYCYQLKQFH